ncbi:MAG: LCP family protein [Dysgonomonas sp.]
MEKKKRHIGKYRKRKICFWVTLIVLLIVSFLMYFFYPLKPAKNKHIIRAGICGAVKHPAVYSIPVGADVSTLVRLANGITADADIAHNDLGEIVMNDTIYHIPARGDKNRQVAFNNEVKDVLSQPFSLSASDINMQKSDTTLRQYNVLYVGLPAVYLLIRYYPTLKRIDLTYIPHSTTFLVNDYRLIDIFFTLDVKPTMRILENKLGCKIDRYIIQDRTGFIDMIDALGGVDVNIDKSYADAYKLEPGKRRIGGLHTWEYIRYIDMKSIKALYTQGKNVDLIRHDNFQADPSAWQQVYDIRLHRQQLVLHAMYKALSELQMEQQLTFAQRFPHFVRTNMDKDFLLSMYADIYVKPQISISVFPGYYSYEGEKLFYNPDIPKFRMLYNQMRRNTLKKTDKREQVTY